MTVEQIARAKEDSIRFQTFESAFAWDAQGNEILAKDGQQDTVNFTPQECLALKDAIFTHNHPDGLNFPDSDPQSAGNSFSPEDIAFAMAYDMAEMRVVTPKLRFTLKRPTSGWDYNYWLSTVKSLLSIIENDVSIEFTRNVQTGSMTNEQYNARYWNEIWLRLSRRLGWNYTRERR